MADSDSIKLCECGCGRPARNRFIHGHNARGVKRDLAGQRFGRLIALRPYASNKHRRWSWEFACDCGAAVVLDANVVTTGNTKSCGCYNRERMRSIKTTHGLSHTPSHNSWIGMRRRCLDPDNPNYPHYGGRGITICERWSSFENFYDDMGERPSGMTLERIDNDGPYSPNNCRWATRTEQLRNQQKTIKLTHDGKTMCLAEWSRETGVHDEVLRDRYHKGDRPPHIFRPAKTRIRRNLPP